MSHFTSFQLYNLENMPSLHYIHAINCRSVSPQAKLIEKKLDVTGGENLDYTKPTSSRK